MPGLITEHATEAVLPTAPTIDQPPPTGLDHPEETGRPTEVAPTITDADKDLTNNPKTTVHLRTTIHVAPMEEEPEDEAAEPQPPTSK